MGSAMRGGVLFLVAFVAIAAFETVRADWELPPLPYPAKALEPHIDAETMTIHHDKIQADHVSKLNTAVGGDEYLESLNLTELVMSVGSRSLPKNITRTVRNHGGGHWNHEFFWSIMSPAATPPATPEDILSPELVDAIEDEFGGIQGMKENFTAAAMSVFGSGWAWLCVDEDGNVGITTTIKQDNPLMIYLFEDDACYPILGLDVWEHGYFLKYKQERANYIGAWWNVVNWKGVDVHYQNSFTLWPALRQKMGHAAAGVNAARKMRRSTRKV